MATNIIAELSKPNEVIAAIKALAQCATDQAFPDENPPHWAVTLEVLAKLAEEEMESLHYRLTELLNGPQEAK